ncbi:ArsR family transcriptional regulator [Halomicroarcula sp. GCM10025710]
MDGTDTLEEASFLVRSPHRIQILEALREAPQTRGDLVDRTGVSRITLGRSLGTMADRKWLARTDGRYHIRPLGEQPRRGRGVLYRGFRQPRTRTDHRGLCGVSGVRSRARRAMPDLEGSIDSVVAEDGKVAACWHEYDRLGMMQQLGVVPENPTA